MMSLPYLSSTFTAAHFPMVMNYGVRLFSSKLYDLSTSLIQCIIFTVYET